MAIGADLSEAVVTVRCTIEETAGGIVAHVEVSMSYQQPLITPIAYWLSKPIVITGSASAPMMADGYLCG